LKVAILIFGEYRTFESVVHSWNCRTWDNVDYYMSTWDYSLEPVERKRFILDWKDEKWANAEFIKKMLPNVTLKIHSNKDKNYQENHDTNRMIFHWKTLYNMLLDSNNNYDAIFMVRTDSMFYIKPSFFKTTLKDTLYVSTIENYGVGDTFFFGYNDVILKFLKNYPDKMDDPHGELREYLDDKFKNNYISVFQNKIVEGVYFKIIRSNSTRPFDYYTNDDNKKDLLSETPFLLSNKFREMLRYYETMYEPEISLTLLIGESCIDEFIYGDVNRLAPESPVPIFQPKNTIKTNGMAGNVKNQLEEFMIPPDKFITNTNSITKKRFIDETSNYMLMRCDVGDDKVERFELENLPDRIYDFIIFSDYNKGFFTESDIENTVKFYREKIEGLNQEIDVKRELVIFIDTKKKLGDWTRGLDFIKLNYKEYLNNKDYIEKNTWLSEKLIITRGEYGCDYNGITYKTNKVNVKDVSGAGVTFLASLVAKYMTTRDIKTSIEFANKISEIVVQKKGVSVVSPHEVLYHQQKLEKLNGLL